MKPAGILASLCVASLTLACGGPNGDSRSVTADEPVIGTSGTDPSIRSADRDFVSELMMAGTAEVKLGQLAAERGSSNQVKDFGQMMVKDHTAAGNKLKMIAEQHDRAPGDVALDQEHQALFTKLSALRGSQFDREYIAAMVDGHEKVIDTLQSRVDERDRVGVATGQAPKDVNVKPEASTNHFEAGLNQWAAEALPVVKGHLERAKAIEAALDRGRNTTASR